MSNSALSGSIAAARDERFDALADASRRAVLRIAQERSPAGIEKNDLAFRLAAVISDTQLASVSEDEHQRALVELHHRLVPQLVDAGFLAETDDGSVVPTEHSAFDDPHCERIVSGYHDADRETLDAVFRALADERRRTVLSVLSNQYHPIGTETLARDVAAREAETTARAVPRDHVDDVEASLVHVHLPLLADAGLIGDDETDRISYGGHPAVRAE
ncbi:hypothetical protein [Natrinema sp. DC36]|uniref:DUF7344 domain-containing protein n=1 Tax=Natrinema sp. DC36 TaxID=2878680 RepID=UPI001CF0ABC0|nr:hypothetical protein [Natrinema sp. DC36]